MNAQFEQPASITPSSSTSPTFIRQFDLNPFLHWS
jgi:hypothetical protein